MSSSAERSLRRASLLACCALAALTACYDHDRCAGPEVCNYADDDCDHRYDEDFRADDGVYATPEHCGGCGVSCEAVFPTAAETACEVSPGLAPRCVLVRCAPGFHRGGEGGCVPDVPGLC